MKRTLIHSALILLALSMLVMPAQAAPVAFSDGTFNDTDWGESVIKEEGPPVSFTVNQDDPGGNPDEYRWLQHSYGGPGSIITAHLRNGAIYDPAIEGAILNVVFSFDLILFDGGASNTVAYGGLAFQNNSYYRGGYALTPSVNAGWQSGYSYDLFASDFVLLSGPGPAIPDFSSSGNPIHFGYYASNGTGLGFPTSTESGIDNWSASIHPVPVPNVVFLFGASIVGVMGCNWQRRKRVI